jgi:hypothetical protein
MQHKDLQAAMAEARRFLKRAEALIDAHKTDPVVKLAAHDFHFESCPREQGAVRRSSMDLTRALADLRRRS